MNSALKKTSLTELHLDPLVKVGPVSHIGIVVKDVEEAVRFYSGTFGVGPFGIVEFDAAKTSILTPDGIVTPKFKAALCYSGDFFIELVQVTVVPNRTHEILRAAREKDCSICASWSRTPMRCWPSSHPRHQAGIL